MGLAQSGQNHCMESDATRLSVRPDDLAATAVRLRACAASLEGARERFRRQTLTDAPALGEHASSAAYRSADAAGRAVDTVGDNLGQLAHALTLLARVYAEVDAGAVRASAVETRAVPGQPESRPSS